MPVTRSDDIILDNQIDIEHHVLIYYTNLYAFENVCARTDLIDKAIPKTVVLAMNGEGAPGLDGFGGCFFQAF